MRRAYLREEVEDAFTTARAEAMAAFGDGQMYMEKLIEDPHHIEFQILADQYGSVIHLGERDCSIQRNNQKVLEESPACLADETLRRKMGEDAVKAAQAAGYNSVGTVEFVVDHAGNYYFIEMNTRIQVEHPVTETVTGIDLVKEQIRVAAGMHLRIRQEDVRLMGHAIECRINARSTGRVTTLHFPEGFGVRIESCLYQGCSISPYYDSMIAKIIVSGQSRLETIRRMRRALEELVIEGIETNQREQYLTTYQADFIRGSYDTSFLNKEREGLWQ